ncbi:hypothetical protein LWI29_037962 [Acer saccharum]|uniref:Uncharacterized protein n=1 Tax=Acer saccharum TaxID=4024 RepID=A0AA39RG70_ACESA|nr:hypothetical protein LWI29_037962 [Acer saccharum]
MSNGNGKQTSGAATEANFERFLPVKKGIRINPAAARQQVSVEKGSGSRFNVLDDKVTEMITVVDEVDATKATRSTAPPQSHVKIRKKGNVVASSSRYVAKLSESCGMPFSASSSRDRTQHTETDDDEAMDSASVLRHLHKEVHGFSAQPVDSMEVVDTPCIQKISALPISGMDKNFDMVASDLKEALAVISE